MDRKSKISLEKRRAIMALHQEGRTKHYIASKLKVSKIAVHNIVRKRETGSLAYPMRSGRPRATTYTEDRRIIIMSKRNRYMTAPEICAEINESRKNRVCVTTVKNRLLKYGLHGCVAVRKPLLRKINKVKRLEWASRSDV